MIQNNIRVECAFTSAPDDATQSYRDITAYAIQTRGIQINNHGRLDEYSQTQPATCAVTFNNSDGRLTPGLATSPYYPNVKPFRRLRVTWRDPTVSGNLLSAEDASFEGGTVGTWTAAGSVPPTLSNSTTHADVGTKALLITWGTGGSFPLANVNMTGLVIGRSYTARARVYVPSGGSPNVSLVIAGIGVGTSSSGTNAFVSITFTFTATAFAHSLQVWPASAPTSGQQVWVDAVRVDEATAPSTFTTNPMPISYRFTGYVSEWPICWPSGGSYAESAVTAVDRFSKISTRSKFRSIIEEEYALDSPYAHYTMGDAEGTANAGDVSPNGRPLLATTQLGSGGTLEFGTATGPGTDGLTAVTFTPTNSTNGKYLSADLTNDGGFFSFYTVTLECFFLTSTVASRTLISLGSICEIDIDGSGKLSTATYGATLTSAGSVADGATHHAALTFSVSGVNVTMTLYLDGVQVGTDTSSSAFIPVWNGAAMFSVGGEPTKGPVSGSVFTGVIAHAAVYNSVVSGARLAEHADAGLTGFEGESSDARISRYASYVGVPVAEQDLEAGLSTSIAHIDITDKSPLTAIQDVADTESGVVFIDGSGALAFHSRGHRYNATSAVTLANTDINELTEFVTNTALLVNDVTASRSGGITTRVTDPVSVAEFGTYQIQGNPLTLVTTSDNEVVDAANWKAHANATPIPRLPGLTVSLIGAAPSVQTAVMALDVGSRVTLSSLPAQAPSASLDQFIEGYSETWSGQGVVFAFNTSPASVSGVWVLDSATYSQLDVSTRLAY